MIDHPAEYRRSRSTGSSTAVSEGEREKAGREARPTAPLAAGDNHRDGHEDESLARIPPRQPPERARPAGGRRLRHDRARARVRHARVYRGGGRPARAGTRVRAGRLSEHGDFHVVFASKAFPCTAVLALFAEEGLWCDVASGGELHLALHAGFAPERIVMHGNAKSEAELAMALDARVGLIVVDNFDELDRLATRLDRPRALCATATASAAGGLRPVLIRVDARTCGARPREDLHRPGATPSSASPTGRRAPRRSTRIRRHPRAPVARACTPTSARSCSTWSRFAARSPRSRGSATQWVGSPSMTSAAASGSPTPTRRPAPPAIEDYVGDAPRAAARARHRRARQAPADRARPRARCQRRGHAVHRRERQAQRLHLGRRRRRDVRQPAPDALLARPTKRTSPTASPAPRRACSPASTASPAT